MTSARLKLGLVAHDHKKDELLDWARAHRAVLAEHELVATGTTGKILAGALGLEVTRLMSGPLGGDQQLGARLAEGQVDLLVFFWDPLEAQPHDPDVKALLRLAVVWNIPLACNRASADLLIASALLTDGYQRQRPDYAAHNERSIGNV